MWNNFNQPQFQQPYPYNFNNNPYNLNHTSFQNQQQNTNQQQQIRTSQNNIIWVKGKENARSMQLPPNSTVILLDSQTGKFYIKTTDDIGLGKLRIFNYTQQPDIQNEEKNNNVTMPLPDLSEYVTKEQLNKLLKEIKVNESISGIKSATTTKSTSNTTTK